MPAISRIVPVTPDTTSSKASPTTPSIIPLSSGSLSLVVPSVPVPTPSVWLSL